MMRSDDFEERRRHLAHMSNEELARYFWELADKVVQPLVDLARTHTSPSIERSVLLRMGFSSLEAKTIVDKCAEKGLLGKGAGHVVWKLANARGMCVRDAGVALAEGRLWDEAAALFGFRR
ncbi:MAG: ornithine aminomutase subunit alpha [Firmicutes bacterium]|jgi:D-ornithine 4,5-aminomutase subunit alpha|nr:ornithine aminomutase subunit alpha [Bacillota bacterium]MDH7495494.1 ornithine aminomutase subunit alpha [Bacillota bacterium]